MGISLQGWRCRALVGGGPCNPGWLRQEIQSSGLDMLDFRSVLAIQVQKLNEQLGDTTLEFRKQVWAGNIHFRVIGV